MGETNQEVLLDDGIIEKDFNDALNDLQKSLESDTGTPLQKAKGKKAPKEEDESEEDEDSSEEEEDEDEGEEYEKSISEILSEDPEAAAAIDVEPFLRQLAKAMDESVASINKSVNKRMATVEKLVKSQGAMLLQTAKLEKSTSDMVRQIGGQPVQTNSVRALNKSRFGSDEAPVDNMTVLQKSRDWVKTRKIDLNEAGMIEGRINKGVLGKSNDRLDQKVAALLKEGN